jgi:hypothetical protein
MKWSYVGLLGPGDQLDWGRSAGGNIPPSGTLPDIDNLSVYQTISRHVTEGRYGGQVVDYDAYGLKVNGANLRYIIETCYQSQPEMLGTPVIVQYLAYADKLPSNQFVAFVAVAM